MRVIFPEKISVRDLHPSSALNLASLSLRDRQNKSLETAKPEEQSTALSMSSLPIFWNKIRQLQRLYVRKQFWRREPEMLPEKQEILPEGRLLWMGSACPENWRTVLTRILKTVRFISSRVILREVPQRRPDPVQPRQSFL
ncbi:unknown [Anaerostipes sp. CAG:276]|nr:unknown [Anaerostipes sp. CAG:276]